MNDSFVDTNILIYAHDLNAGHRHEQAARLVLGLWENGGAIISTQVLHEFYVNITRKIPAPVTPAKARAIIEPYLTWNVQMNEPASVLRASEIQERYQLSFWDALIISAAFSGGAARLYSEDLNHGQIIEGIEIINPFSDPGIHETQATYG